MSISISEEEELAVLGLSRAVQRLKELGWRNIADFEPEEKDFGSAPFLALELESLRPVECEYDEDEDVFTTLDDDETDVRDEHGNPEVRIADLIMFRHYEP